MIADLTQKEWDVVIVGAGMGGGVIGRRLSEQGLSVLFVDRGRTRPRGECQPLQGDPGDRTSDSAGGNDALPLHAIINGRSATIPDAIGAGIGGTSVFYAASLERPERHDLDDSAVIGHPTGGWPVGYDAFQFYFEMAEKLFHVCGDPDPLSREQQSALFPVPALSDGDALLMADFRGNGLHPYRTHMGIRYLPGCAECIGRKCPRPCKMDGRSAGVEPALATGRAALIDGCEVTALRGRRGRVTHLEAVRGGEKLRLTAKRVVLCAGAFGSPRLLLASAAEAWPQGCANESGLVGRNLMFHLSERIAIWPKRRADFTGPAKTLALRDFYHHDGMRFGLFQSMGLGASYGNIVHHLNGKFDRKAPRALAPLRGFSRIPAFLAARVFGNARIFVGILEDLPYEANRVVLDRDDPARIRFEYSLEPELLRRRQAFRTLIKKSLQGQRAFFLNIEPELNFSHPCGTLRFGADPARSVLDPSCRAHGLDNLYVADSSFMPTSGGISPSLTIAANALRVADEMVTALR